ncbi:polymer-forming cytoskeletal protein [Prosthecobacter vanneervenii]|uniref:Cytoskeletal protein CcmA (Bactofilin family) n=1 Tax=Prosthecobacter vanneervenii TaxID=48466 RepID=A0A7W7YDV9_9BACT|nr:polymer-forming cytoskeletal protein [Prosthecobacter vanneervenii]MBB5034349.1 cytoskeletal protein CcmA (bactofilin family) [Prosthecobacter vanneervenii]
MLDPFATLEEAGFSLRRAGGMDRLAGWSPELIAGMDWARVSELARAIATEAGCEVAGSRVMPDGAVHFGMIEEPKSAKAQRAMVKTVPWNEWGATPETVQRFAQEVGGARNVRGILIAPGGFSPAALRAAQELRIEAVDAAGLDAAVRALPREKSDYLFVITTAGDFSVPSCPVCLKKLQRVEQEAFELPSRLFDMDGLIADNVVCDRLEVAAGCDVTFLHEVKARAISVSGHVAGDFVCEGPVILESGGTLSGTVAARSLVVRDGGQLLGQFRILEGELGSFVKPVVRWHWRCAGEEGKRECAWVVFEPHE